MDGRQSVLCRHSFLLNGSLQACHAPAGVSDSPTGRAVPACHGAEAMCARPLCGTAPQLARPNEKVYAHRAMGGSEDLSREELQSLLEIAGELAGQIDRDQLV